MLREVAARIVERLNPTKPEKVETLVRVTLEARANLQGGGEYWRVIMRRLYPGGKGAQLCAALNDIVKDYEKEKNQTIDLPRMRMKEIDEAISFLTTKEQSDEAANSPTQG